MRKRTYLEKHIVNKSKKSNWTNEDLTTVKNRIQSFIEVTNREEQRSDDLLLMFWRKWVMLETCASYWKPQLFQSGFIIDSCEPDVWITSFFTATQKTKPYYYRYF